MKDKIIHTLKDIARDRTALLTLTALLVASIVFIVYVAFGLRYKDMPVVTHYTAFGSQHLYDTSWLEVLSFVGFGVFIAAIHSLLFIKLRQSKDEKTASVFVIATFLVLFIAFFVAHQVLRVASL
jgi:phosphoglycerol transferase MdoB-like AlkP superfamily enzyme